MDDTLIIDLAGGQNRERAQNNRTIIARRVVTTHTRDFQNAFEKNYARIRGAVGQARQRGLVAVAVYRWRVSATATLASRSGELRAMSIGRHGSADLFVDQDPSLSLRHLLVLALPDPGRGNVRFRLLDLRSGTSLRGENGRRLEAIEAEGPVFVLVGETMVFLFPTTPDDPPWPERAEDGWARLPGRVYEGEDDEARPAFPERLRHVDTTLTSARQGQTLITMLQSPIANFRELVGEGERPRGRFVITGDGDRAYLSVGAEALRRGVLLGRYRRCDNAGLPALRGDPISRVHVLLVQLDGRLYAIDVGSTNGSFLEGEPLRQALLPARAKLSLAHAARVRWEPYH